MSFTLPVVCSKLTSVDIFQFRSLVTCHGISQPSLSRIVANPIRLGVKTHIFHLGDYRRATMGPGVDVPEDYFFINAAAKSVMIRQKILKKCREDIYAWLNHENGQVAIYDAVNPLSAGRESLAKEFAKHDVQVRKCVSISLVTRTYIFADSFLGVMG